MKKITTLLFALIAAFSLQAQVVNVCGTDSIVLQVENYDGRGVIEWQESIDSINWVTIPEFVGEMYRFLPTQTKYYRAVVKTSTCDPLYSAFSFVQLPPVANAGVDRIIGGTTLNLMGNKILGAFGEWTVLEGDSGVLAEPQNPYSQFFGKYNVPYKLKWTVTNPCGQSSDTVNIKFELVKVNLKYIVVDNTDSLLSDSTEMGKGLYKIKFSDPTLAPYDSVMLIGIRDSLSFLRRVVSFSLQDSIYSFETVQGYLSDLFEKGHLNLGDIFNQSMFEMNEQSNTLPTRQSIKNSNLRNSDISILYSAPVNGISKSSISRMRMNNDNEIYIPIASQTIFDEYPLTFSIEDIFLRFRPNFVADIEHSGFPFYNLNYMRFGLDNALFEYNYKLKLNCTLAKNFEKDNIILYQYTRIIVPYVFGVPIPIAADFKIAADFVLGVSSTISFEQNNNYKKYFTTIIEGSDQNDLKLIQPKPTEYSTQESDFKIRGDIYSHVKIGPEISFSLFNILSYISPKLNFIGSGSVYLNFPFIASMDLCVNPDGNFHQNIKFGVSGNFGSNAEIFGFNLFDFNKPIFANKLLATYDSPDRLKLLSGDFQKGKSNEKLTKPIVMQVLSSVGTAVPFVPVKLELENGNGFVESAIVKSNSLGIVEINWTLGTNNVCALKVSVLDCDYQNIENSPIYVTAYAEGITTSCENSNLAISIKTADTFKYPSVSGGTAPYTYSTNATAYSSTVPHYSLSAPGSFIVYVKDKNGCLVTKSFTVNSLNACTNSDLTMDITVLSNILKVTGKKGLSPYQYAIDNNTSFSSVTTYSNLTAGYHTVYVKDAKGCIISSEVKIDANTRAAIKAVYPAAGASYIPTTGITFQWTAATYTTNQRYDLYLKKGTEAYTLIASNLNPTSFTYNTALLANTIYTWKVDVKGSNGNVIDFSAFTFTTASGVTTAPTAPLLLQPASGASVYSPATFRWTPQAGDFKYDVYMDANNATTLVAMNLTTAECAIGKLTSGKTYYWKVKIKSTITGATATSEIGSFKAMNSGNTVTDIDGNVYHTVTIGTQTWMVENLKTTRYRNGDAIGTTTASIPNNATYKYQWAYNNDENNVAKYGRLYTWYAATDTRNIAPAGWHVPTDAEWTTLETYLITNGYNYDGTTTGNKIAKSLAATTDWNTYTTTGTIGNDLTKNNSSGFSALPGGCRSYDGTFFTIGYYGCWWSSTKSYITSAYGRRLSYGSAGLYRSDYDKSYGFSVRCIRD